jgi:hypothetical protein
MLRRDGTSGPKLTHTLALLSQVEVAKALLTQQLEVKVDEVQQMQQELDVLRAELAASRQFAHSSAAVDSSPTSPSSAATHSVSVSFSTSEEGSASWHGASVQKKQSLAACIVKTFSKRTSLGTPIAPVVSQREGASAAALHSQEHTPALATAHASAAAAAAMIQPAVLWGSEGGSSDAGSVRRTANITSGGGASSSQEPGHGGSPDHGLLPLSLNVSVLQTAQGDNQGEVKDSLATTSKACPGGQELVEHFEEVVARTPSCTSMCSVQSEVLLRRESLKGKAPTALTVPAVQAPTTAASAAASPKGAVRPTPLPRVAGLTKGSSSATSPRSPSAAVQSSKGSVAKSSSGTARTAFGRSLQGPVATTKSPALSAATSGTSTPSRQATASSGGPDMIAVSKRLHAAAAAGGNAPTAAAAAAAPSTTSRMPAPGALTRSGSASSSKSEAAPSAEQSSLRKSLSRLVPGSSNGSVSSERGSHGGGQGSIFKQKPAGAIAASRAGAGRVAGSKKAGSEAGPARKAK